MLPHNLEKYMLALDPGRGRTVRRGSASRPRPLLKPRCKSCASSTRSSWRRSGGTTEEKDHLSFLTPSWFKHESGSHANLEVTLRLSLGKGTTCQFTNEK